MPQASQIDLDELYVLAQLAAKDEAEASRLVENAVLRKRKDPTCSSKLAILEQVSGSVQDGSSDLLKRARFTNEIIETIPAIFANFNPQLTDASYEEKYPYVITETVILRNVTTASGKALRLSNNPFMFNEVKV